MDRRVCLPIYVSLERLAVNIASSESCVTTRYKQYAATKVLRLSRNAPQYLRPNALSEFTVDAPDCEWVTDIT